MRGRIRWGRKRHLPETHTGDFGTVTEALCGNPRAKEFYRTAWYPGFVLPTSSLCKKCESTAIKRQKENL